MQAVLGYAGSDVVELQRFVWLLKKDKGAVRTRLSLHSSKGQTEGRMHRLKLAKRQSYGSE